MENCQGFFNTVWVILVYHRIGLKMDRCLHVCWWFRFPILQSLQGYGHCFALFFFSFNFLFVHIHYHVLHWGETWLVLALFSLKTGLKALLRSLVALSVKNSPELQEMLLQSLVREGALKKDMATHSSILAWEIPWTEEPGQATVHGVTKSWTWLSN